MMGNKHDLLLLSGGLDSTALAGWLRPAVCLFIDYGQRSNGAEATASRVVAEALELPYEQVRIDCSPLGSGLLRDEQPVPNAPSPEWWPFRNQMLVTFAAAFAVARGLRRILVGTVATDGERHADGTAGFYERLDALTRIQEGSIEVATPALGLRTEELLKRSAVTDAVLGWTVSCHTASLPCGTCPGCRKRATALHAAGRNLA